MKKLTLLLVSILCAFTTFAQTNKPITGKVIDLLNNKPITGATIEISNTKVGTTNSNGEFSVTTSEPNPKLKISCEGYITSTLTANYGDPMNISLKKLPISITGVNITANANSNKAQLTEPISVVQLKTAEIKRGDGLFLDDAINNNVPGVLMERRASSSGQQLNIRGYGNGMGKRGISGNFDSQGLKMYVNGIPITDAEGVTMMDDIDFNSVDNVDVKKGPNGTLYGLAIAGVVNLEMQKAAKDTTSISQEFLAGSYGLMRTTTKLELGTQNSSLLVNYGHQQFDGFMPHTKSHKDFVNVIGDVKVNDKESLSTYFGFINSYDEKNGELSVDEYNNLEYNGNPYYIKNDAHSAVRTFRGGLNHVYKINEHFSNSTTFFGSGQSIDQSSGGGWADNNKLNYGLRSVINNNFKLSDKITLSGIIGLELQRMNTVVAGYGMSTDSTNPSGYNVITSIKSNQGTIDFTSSYFTQWTLNLPHDISVNAGVGISNMKIGVENRLWGISNNSSTNNIPKSYEAKYKNLVAPSFAINKKINDNFSVYGSFNIAYKAPVAANIIIPTTGQLNSGLKPEKGTQFEIGTKGNLLSDRLFYTVALFNAKFTNKFTSVAVPNPANTVTLYSYLVNAGEVNDNGLEVLVKYEVMKSKYRFVTSLQPFANLTYSDFKYGEYEYQTVGKSSTNTDSLVSVNYKGNQVAGVSPIVYNIGADVFTKIGLYGNATYNYRGAMYFTSDELNQTKSFGLLNAKIGFRKSIKNFDIDAYFGANNITGSQYYYMVFINQLPDAYIPAPNEINFFGGVSLKYNL